MNRNSVLHLPIIVAIMAVAVNLSLAQSVMTHHVREVVMNGTAPSISRLPATQMLSLDIVLPLSDPAGLETFLTRLYDPSSSTFHHYLTPTEFTAKFGPTQMQYDQVLAFAKASGLTVTGGSRDGMEVQVKGTVLAVEQALHVNMLTYQHPTENRAFYSADREPTTSLPFDLWHISGLENYSIPHPLLVNRNDYALAIGIQPDHVFYDSSTC